MPTIMAVTLRGKGSLILSLVLLCHVIGLLIFAKGFLLKRIVIPEHSKCEHQDNHSSHPSTCNEYPRAFKRVIWILIDALRYDFAVYDETLDPNPPPHRNKMPFIRDLLREKPHNTKLFKSVADPPTTTMQRVKALTTGGLPTFVDFSMNFNSYEVFEDSLPQQCLQNGRHITFIGDDIWLGLYPSHFDRAFAFPGLNVFDLDTVDNKVKRHLVPEVERGDADFLIGHLLGVDHCGHTHSPSHSCMARKLSEMNDVLQSVLPMVDNDTIVFVFGDHGMTSTGDHGGETELETAAAMLVYTPRPIFDPKFKPESIVDSVYQVDIVPTVCLLLGIPIPFSNLGMAIAEVLLPYSNLPTGPHKSEEIHQAILDQTRAASYAGRVTPQFLSALKTNAKQLHTYLVTYSQYANDFQQGALEALTDRLRAAEKLHSLATHERREGEILQTNLTAAAGAYYQFMSEARSMCQAIWAQFDDLFIFLGLSLVAAVAISLILILLSTRLLQDYGAKESHLRFMKRCLSVDGCDVVAGVGVLFHSLSLVSNSFVVYEQDVVVFLVQTLLFSLLVTRVRQVLNSEYHQPSRHSWTALLPLLIKVSWRAFGAMICVRLTKLFIFCRDQQLDCVQTSLALPLASAMENMGWLALVRYAVSSIALLTTALLSASYFMNSLGKYASPLLKVAVMFGIPFAAICVCLFWGFLALPPSIKDNLPSWAHVLLPRLVYSASLWVIVVAIGWLLQRPVESDHGGKAHSEKLQYGPSSAPASIWLAPLQLILVSVWVPLCMLLNDAVCLSACLFIVQLVLTLQLLKELPQVSLFFRSVLCSLFSFQYFFGFWHQATMTSLRFEAGFVGLHGEVTQFTLPFAGTLVGLNLMASHILGSLALPLFLPPHLGSLWNLFQLMLFYLIIGSLRLFVACLTASIHRRHLMVWAVFGPRFLYETGFQCLSDLLLLLIFRVLTRHSRLQESVSLRHKEH